MIDKKRAIKYCKDDISLIENYDKAIADDTQTWHCHHRREKIYSVKELIDIGEYYNRPACELIFLTPTEHHKLHNFGKYKSAEHRKKMSEALKGRQFSAETCKKMSEARKGKHRSDEIRKKISESAKGKHLSAEHRKKLSESHKGKQRSAETCKKIAEARKGNHWYNNGDTNILAKTCPEGFVPGRLK